MTARFNEDYRSMAEESLKKASGVFLTDTRLSLLSLGR